MQTACQQLIYFRLASKQHRFIAAKYAAFLGAVEKTVQQHLVAYHLRDVTQSSSKAIGKMTQLMHIFD